MKKKRRPSLTYKRQMQPNRKYEDLRQKHKIKIAGWMFQAVCGYYQEHHAMPDEAASAEITDKVYEKIVSTNIWVPYDEVYRHFLSELPQYETRIKEGGPSDKPQHDPSKPAPPVNSTRKSGKICPNCGRKMKQQFIGLKHCKCGMSWQRGEGFFERSDDMVFALERRKSGKKVKQHPVIRHRDDH